MQALFLFENKVVLYSLRLLSILLIILLLLVVFFFNFINHNEEITTIQGEYEYTISDYNRVNSLILDESEYLKDGFTSEEYQSDYENITQTNSEWFELSNSLLDEDYTRFYSYQIDKLQSFETNRLMDDAFLFPELPFNGSYKIYNSYVNGQTRVFNELLNRNLKLETPRYGISNFMFQLSIMKYLTGFIGVLILLLLIGFPLLRKYEERNIAFISTLPIAPWKVLSIDSLVFFVYSTVFLVVVLLFSFIIGQLFGGDIPYDYPISIFISPSVVSIPLYKIIIELSVIFLVSINFVFQLICLLTLLTKKAFISILLGSVTIFVISFFSFYISRLLPNFCAWNPFNYLSTYNLLIGESFEMPKRFQFESNDVLMINYSYFSGDSLLSKFESMSISKGIVSFIFFSSFIMLLQSIVLTKSRNKGV